MYIEILAKSGIVRRVPVVVAAGLIVVGLAPWSSASAHKPKTLYAFCAQSGCSDGSGPNVVTFDAAGDLIGTTSTGGAHGGGTAFRLLAGGGHKWKHEVIYDFCAKSGCGDGNGPSGALIEDTAGNLYGMTYAGGTANTGTVFELMPTTHKKWKLKVLYSFAASGDGSGPVAALTYAGASTGVLYDGTSPLFAETLDGGSIGDGVVFKLTPGASGWTEQLIHGFDWTDGGVPVGQMAADVTGNLFGTTLLGGTDWPGVLFEMSASTGQETVLYNFQDGPDGGEPGSNLLFDASGSLFGTAEIGGAHAKGVAFKFAVDGSAWHQTILYDFCAQADCVDGSTPIGNLAMDAAGDIFGTTYSGGGHDIDANGLGGGTVFELNGTLRKLYSFCAAADCTDGEYPFGVVLGASGDVFGVTEQGGPNGAGTVFELTP